MEALKAEVNHEALLSGSSNRHYRLFPIIRTAISKYGTSCTTNLLNGALVWQKAVRIIWPENHTAICTAK